MNRNGFSLIEMILVIVLCMIVIAFSSRWFRNTTDKSTIETEFRKLYSDLQEVKSEALYRKRARSVRISSTAFSVYSSLIPTASTTILPTTVTPLKAPVTVPANLQIDFDQMGFATPSDGSTAVYICVSANANKADYNSIILSQTLIQLGNLSGAGCTSANVRAQ